MIKEYPLVPAIYVGEPRLVGNQNHEIRYGRTGTTRVSGKGAWFFPDGFSEGQTLNMCLKRQDIYVKPDDLKRHCPAP